jgi:hypothetical protein
MEIKQNTKPYNPKEGRKGGKGYNQQIRQTENKEEHGGFKPNYTGNYVGQVWWCEPIVSPQLPRGLRKEEHLGPRVLRPAWTTMRTDLNN